MMTTFRQFHVVGAIGLALPFARNLVMVLWATAALAFWLVVIAGCVL